MAFAPTHSAAERGIPQQSSQSSSMDRSQEGSVNTNPEDTGPMSVFDEVSPYCRFREPKNEKSTHPAGFPRLAAMCEQWPNFQFCNGFTYERWRLLLSKQARLTCLSDQLLAYDKKNPDKVKGLTANHQRPAGQPKSMDEFEIILTEIEGLIQEIDTLSTGIRMINQLPVMHREQWGDHLEHIYDKVLDKDACKTLFTPQDIRMISRERQPPRWVFRTSACIINLYNRCFRPNSGQEHDYIPMDILTVIFTAIHTVIAVLMILLPAGAMYLPELDKTERFAVIGVSFLTFCLVMSAKKEVNPSITILAATSYMAFCGAFAFDVTGGGSLV
ncbi:hypothetical protein B0T21DRAFT_126488 [Apiosordaria backusii]|uniref:DUF6594 domain-containing protein n=1 Tax=Apiosordaria backusii TaxID=314023 RepID=A0AA40EMV9_9PEZI|nr:hypothetical protein B0T21DRAFT_126488 [Apiosordaria backusii]